MSRKIWLIIHHDFTGQMWEVLIRGEYAILLKIIHKPALANKSRN